MTEDEALLVERPDPCDPACEPHPDETQVADSPAHAAWSIDDLTVTEGVTLAEAVAQEERQLLGALAAWATGSAAVGAATWVVGARTGRPRAVDFGRQTLVWAVVDGVIALVGAVRFARASRGPDAECGRAAVRRGTRLRRSLAVNAALDVGYLATGTTLLANPRGRLAGRRGDGLAVVLQGAFLLAQDVRYAVRLGRLLP